MSCDGACGGKFYHQPIVGNCCASCTEIGVCVVCSPVDCAKDHGGGGGGGEILCLLCLPCVLWCFAADCAGFGDGSETDRCIECRFQTTACCESCCGGSENKLPALVAKDVFYRNGAVTELGAAQERSALLPPDGLHVDHDGGNYNGAGQTVDDRAALLGAAAVVHQQPRAQRCFDGFLDSLPESADDFASRSKHPKGKFEDRFWWRKGNFAFYGVVGGAYADSVVRAVRVGDTAALATLKPSPFLLYRGTEPATDHMEASSTGYRLLHWACVFGQLEVLQWILFDLVPNTSVPDRCIFHGYHCFRLPKPGYRASDLFEKLPPNPKDYNRHLPCAQKSPVQLCIVHKQVDALGFLTSLHESEAAAHLSPRGQRDWTQDSDTDTVVGAVAEEGLRLHFFHLLYGRFVGPQASSRAWKTTFNARGTCNVPLAALAEPMERVRAAKANPAAPAEASLFFGQRSTIVLPVVKMAVVNGWTNLGLGYFKRATELSHGGYASNAEGLLFILNDESMKGVVDVNRNLGEKDLLPTPLFRAAASGHHELVAAFLRAGSNPGMRNKRLQRPVDVASTAETMALLRRDAVPGVREMEITADLACENCDGSGTVAVRCNGCYGTGGHMVSRTRLVPGVRPGTSYTQFYQEREMCWACSGRGTTSSPCQDCRGAGTIPTTVVAEVDAAE
mmetsp:Transcript_25218/g.75937  ORF Transcript_25218/g.75937 Transcript_25218/m.75937 type:complete len:677 (-) Transcript_25218:222-2252(-)|eukprot:CAMPEP_0206294442 /NCGR_PEP_ID=MMETSP0106_2-20121207/4660_1 /ASSEMBLY_ACC=CAM_ASM_000206 /TAXON_ID=81532 /ORGANISM="Acanthoeca-like sp., Strain 10tr" /LENGTH=676 /DNA_ID=CAMNT_0053725079 /DNA_START=336 /DNA_END=2366 /DNA_ORIENTATION=-